jgi:chemotaxis protein histidine kinase CheA
VTSKTLELRLKSGEPKEEKDAALAEMKVGARQVELTIKCARHLPKMDLMGTCDAFCEIEWQGEKQKTTVKKNSYSPDWDETFSFSFDDISGALSDLSVVVMDWDMLTKADLVGKVVIPASTLKSFLQQEQNVTLEGSYPVLNEGKAVTGNDKQPCVINLKMCLLVPNEKPLPTVTASLQEQNQRREMEAARKLAEETQREAEEARRKRELMEARRKIEEEQALNEDIAEKKRQEEESRKDEERHEQEKMRKAAAAKKKEEQDKAAAAKKEEEDKAAEKAAVAKKKEVDKAAAKAAAEKAASEAKVVILANIRRCLCVSGKI